MRLFLAGYETVTVSAEQDFLNDDYSCFATYFYKDRLTRSLRDYTGPNSKKIITIDSGVHSFLGFVGKAVTSGIKRKAKKKKMPDPQEYFDSYIEWLKEYWDYYSYFVEFDLQEMVGKEKVLEWRERYKEEGLFGKAILVYHTGDTDDDYEWMLDNSESRYVALEGLRGGKQNLPYGKLIQKAYEHPQQVKVHGFAMVRHEYLKKYPFYSADSMSWRVDEMWGTIMVFNGHRIKSIRRTRENFAKYKIPKTLLSWDAKGQENRMVKQLFAAEQYLAYQGYWNRYWKKRGIVWKE